MFMEKSELKRKNYLSDLFAKLERCFINGNVYLSDKKDYFPKDFTINIPSSSKIFKRERSFIAIFFILHLHQNLNTNNNRITRFLKVKNCLDYINSDNTLFLEKKYLWMKLWCHSKEDLVAKPIVPVSQLNGKHGCKFCLTQIRDIQYCSILNILHRNF